MLFEGKAVTLQAPLKDCSQGQHREVRGGKAFNLGRAGLEVKPEAKYTLKAEQLHEQTWPTWTV